MAMFILEKAQSYGKQFWRYCRLISGVIKRNWKPILVFLCVFSLIAYIIGVLLTVLIVVSYFLYSVYQLCDQLLYNPDCPKDSRSKVLTPKSYGFRHFETHYITTEDNVIIHSILLKRPSHEESLTSPTLVYFHGNAGNIGHRLPNAIDFVNRLKCNVLLVEYRGFGLSKGSPSESGLLQDAYAALKFLYGRNDICSSKIVLFGRSLGGAVVIGVAHLLMTSSKLKNYKPAALIVENTFTSIPEISRHLLCSGRSQSCFARFFRLIPNFFYKNQYQSLRAISTISLPTLFISGLADELIPSEMMQKLFNSSLATYKELHKFEGGNHNFTWKCAQYYPTIVNFLQKIFQKSHQFPALNEQGSQESHDEASSSAVDEKSPLISTEEFQLPSPSDLTSTEQHQIPNSVVKYHSQDSSGLVEQQSGGSLVNPNYEEANGQLLQLLDTGYKTQVVIAIDGTKYAELVDI